MCVQKLDWMSSTVPRLSHASATPAEIINFELHYGLGTWTPWPSLHRRISKVHYSTMLCHLQLARSTACFSNWVRSFDVILCAILGAEPGKDLCTQVWLARWWLTDVDKTDNKVAVAKSTKPDKNTLHRKKHQWIACLCEVNKHWRFPLQEFSCTLQTIWKPFGPQ